MSKLSISSSLPTFFGSILFPEWCYHPPSHLDSKLKRVFDFFLSLFIMSSINFPYWDDSERLSALWGKGLRHIYFFIWPVPCAVSGRYTGGAQKMLVEWMTDCPIDIISVISLWLLLFFTFHSTAFILVQVLVVFDLDSCNDLLIALIVSFLIIYCMYCF